MTRVRLWMWGLWAAVVVVWSYAGWLLVSHDVPERRGGTAPPKTAPMSGSRSEAATTEVPALVAAIIDRPGARPPGPLIPGKVPLGERGSGDASVTLRLRGDPGLVPIAMDVRLWRLDVPESPEWNAGDQAQAWPHVPIEGVTIHGLPRGRYRVQCLDLRSETADPPEFELRGGTRECVMDVAHRRWFRLRLMLAGADGEPVWTSIQESRGGSKASRCEWFAPAWANPRRPRLEASDGEVLGSGVACGVGGPPGEPVVADEIGFYDLGRHRERGTSGREARDSMFLSVARSDVQLHVDDAIGVDTTFVGMAVPLPTLVATVTTADGNPVDLGSVKVTATSRAVRCPWSEYANAWHTIPVHVTIRCAGCSTLTFDWTADTADEPHLLK